MILWFTHVQVAVAVAAGLLCIVAGLAGRRPSDWTVGSLALVELLLIVQIVIAIVAPFDGNPPTGALLEFWVYLVSAALLPPRGRRLGAARAQPLEHGDHGHRGARRRRHGLAHARHLDRPGRLTEAPATPGTSEA